MFDRFRRSICDNKILVACNYHTLLLISSIVLVGFYNTSFWRVITPDILQYLGNTGFVIMPLAYVLILFGACEIMCGSINAKLFLSVIFIVAGVSGFFMNSMGIGIDESIIESVFGTNIREGKDFISINFLAHNLLFILLPLVIIFLFPITIKSNKESAGFYNTFSYSNTTNIIPPPHTFHHTNSVLLK